MTVRHLRTLTSARALLDRGAASGAMQRELGMQEWQVRNAVAQARRFGADELSRALREAADLEARLKSGQGEPRVIFEMWLAGVCARSS
jgi:DNA polymerase III delta subunit